MRGEDSRGASLCQQSVSAVFPIRIEYLDRFVQKLCQMTNFFLAQRELHYGGPLFCPNILTWWTTMNWQRCAQQHYCFVVA
jgi:hypothetical protein